MELKEVTWDGLVLGRYYLAYTKTNGWIVGKFDGMDLDADEYLYAMKKLKRIFELPRALSESNDALNPSVPL